MAPILESAHIKNFKSLGDINLSFSNLTIIAGANSSGKSCCLESLNLLKILIKAGKTPPSRQLEDDIRIGEETSGVTLQVSMKDSKKKDSKKIDYSINLSAQDNIEGNSIVLSENLKVGRTKVIAISKGKGLVRDEINNNNKDQLYRSTPDTVALSSTGNFGDKPITLKVSDFIKRWEFYDLDPDLIRGFAAMSSRYEGSTETLTSLGNEGHQLQSLLQQWALEDNNQTFQKVTDEVRRCLNVELIIADHKGKRVVKVKENNVLEIPFENLSDGTVRMIGYCSLLYSEDIPTLIGIEEPERNLHPKILIDLASILKRLSQKTQVIITTHSSQLLDCFTMKDIASDVSIILFKKNPESGTEALGLDTLNKKNDGLQDWMQDFGIGSAVYHSNLIQEVLEN
ncbi:hypothetical protein APA_3273 [Pseudanabaena sp. lw0831]|uniref:AAA family ATPase n=1 Tax=Pseudanabaena sp. lw0831 TaxID=1357935 RepID=UPI00191553D9|nr:AAA family ATPase [Pseudanabaena sp. lw0831]GBO55223.1 hypothetical protein APA_3273 [Pseudanabaena sp. lw0831]